MKEYLRTLLREASTPVHARNIVREYLQARLLGALQSAGAMIPLAFHGGTALRFLFSIARYSEDLNFALEGDRAQYNFRGYLRAIQSELSAEGYALRLKVNDRKTVHSAFVHFDGLLYEMGLSPHRNASMVVKIEVDTRPPAGAVLTTTIVRRHETLQLQHHDRASLLAGKLHALMQRAYTKGRDVYDLLWYLSDPNWPEPNLTLLNNALKQTLVDERERLYRSLQEVSFLEPYRSQGNFVLCRVVGCEAKWVKEELMRRGILVRYFDQAGLREHIRVSVGRAEDSEVLLKALYELDLVGNTERLSTDDADAKHASA